MRQKGNLKAGLDGSSVCRCLRRFHIQREEAHHLSTRLGLLLWKPLSKQAVILCIIKQRPGFSIGIKNSTEVWFPCPFAAAGCSPRPQVCLNSSCGWPRHSQMALHWQRSSTSQTVPEHVSRVFSRHMWNIFQLLLHKRWSLMLDPEFTCFWMKCCGPSPFALSFHIH